MFTRVSNPQFVVPSARYQVGLAVAPMGGGAGGLVTVNVIPLLVPPVVVTVTGPVVAPVGTAHTICVADQELALAAFPLKRTVEVPWVLPNTVPVTLTCAPTWPDGGARPLIVGGATVALATESGFLKPGIEKAAAQKAASRITATKSMR
jgi:hypothetical protein